MALPRRIRRKLARSPEGRDVLKAQDEFDGLLAGTRQPAPSPEDPALAKTLATAISAGCSQASWYDALDFTDGLPSVQVLELGSEWDAFVFCRPRMIGAGNGAPIAHQACREIAAVAPPGIHTVVISVMGRNAARCTVGSAQPSP